MDPITIGLLAGAGMGVLKGMGDKKKEAADRKVAAETARWSPWTGMQPEQVQRADMMGSAMQGGLAGGAMGQGFAQTGAYEDYLAALTAKPTVVPPPGSTSPWVGASSSPPARQGAYPGQR